MKHKETIILLGIIGILSVPAIINEIRGPKKEMRNWNYNELLNKPHEDLEGWRNWDIKYENALIDLLGIKKEELIDIYKYLEASMDSVWFMEAANYGDKPSNEFRSAYNKMLRGRVNEIMIMWKKDGIPNSLTYSQNPPEIAPDPSIYPGPAITIAIKPDELLKGKNKNEQDSIIKNEFERIIKMANICYAEKICYQEKSYIKLGEERRKEGNKEPVNIHQEMMKNELK